MLLAAPPQEVFEVVLSKAGLQSSRLPSLSVLGDKDQESLLAMFRFIEIGQ